MHRLFGNRVAVTGAVIIAILASVAVACGNDDDDNDRQPVEPSPTMSGAGASVPSSGSVAPNTFLTFEGQRFRLVDLQQADLMDESGFDEVGEATEADIDQDDLTVYRKGDDPEAVYTYAEGAESEVVGEGVPALWYRWVLEP